MQAPIHTAQAAFSQLNAIRTFEALAQQQAVQQVPVHTDSNPESELSHIVELGYN